MAEFINRGCESNIVISVKSYRSIGEAIDDVERRIRNIEARIIGLRTLPRAQGSLLPVERIIVKGPYGELYRAEVDALMGPLTVPDSYLRYLEGALGRLKELLNIIKGLGDVRDLLIVYAGEVPIAVVYNAGDSDYVKVLKKFFEYSEGPKGL